MAVAVAAALVGLVLDARGIAVLGRDTAPGRAAKTADDRADGSALTGIAVTGVVADHGACRSARSGGLCGIEFGRAR
jgi:hypothetical protein